MRGGAGISGMGGCRPGCGRRAALRALRALRIALALLAAAAGAAAASRPMAAAAAAAPADEFFVVSSIDAGRGRIVLKRPTEVTLVMHVTGRTAYRDERGRPLRLADLRAGDTAYISYARDAAGEATASLVRLGPMTLQELERRYPRGGAPAPGH
jgi:hypothetical protein